MMMANSKHHHHVYIYIYIQKEYIEAGDGQFQAPPKYIYIYREFQTSTKSIVSCAWRMRRRANAASLFAAMRSRASSDDGAAANCCNTLRILGSAGVAPACLDCAGVAGVAPAGLDCAGVASRSSISLPSVPAIADIAAGDPSIERLGCAGFGMAGGALLGAS